MSLPTEPVTVVVIDDHPMFRKGLVMLLEGSSIWRILGDVDGGREGLALIREQQPQLVLLDWHMPAFSGMQVLEEIRTLSLECKVVVLTASQDREDLLLALRLGANGYLLKDTDPDELQDYLLQCCSAEVVLKGQMVSLLLQPEGAQGSPPFPGQINLTARETQTFELLARGLSNKLIAREMGISDGTVKIYVKSLLRKFKVRSRLDLAASFHRVPAP
ncbi:hypothetical protein AAV94_07800 [Lampropedia cohaerens]|uniref:LuxR family transcriptional regulator n=1 Tax=Lampropedia cohaerens TaxID=1610491 RepID=A0A0U1PZU0_9BURK|nr:response regulator [Lampropedia cohaerens]KKW68044.1 hypothetical protein AAV94_07800 [Lampropedia cohaerens]